jgi:hypothetical protein
LGGYSAKLLLNRSFSFILGRKVVGAAGVSGLAVFMLPVDWDALRTAFWGSGAERTA